MSWCLTTTIVMVRGLSCVLDQQQGGSMGNKHVVTLTDDAREHVLAFTKRGKVAARQLSWAHILLRADAGPNDDAMAHALHVGKASVERTRKRFVEEGLEAVLAERPRPGGDASQRGSRGPS